MKKILQDFKDFINKGNVVDMAVGVMIGGAFNSIVTSLVNDIMTPIISAIIGNVNFSELALVITKGENQINIAYGLFIQNVVNFLITAGCIFIAVRGFQKIKEKLEKKHEEEKEVEEAKPSAEVQLLTEIKTLLENKVK